MIFFKWGKFWVFGNFRKPICHPVNGEKIDYFDVTNLFRPVISVAGILLHILDSKSGCNIILICA